MAGRYAIVDEPEALGIVDDDHENVYNPDQSMSDLRTSVRSLEPIVAGPIGLKELFYDPRWSHGQRKCCLVVLIVISIVCVSLLLALFVGLIRVLNEISRIEELRSKGVVMIPNLRDQFFTTFLYGDAAKDSTYNKTNNAYIHELHSYIAKREGYIHELAASQKEHYEYVECKPNERPDLTLLTQEEFDGNKEKRRVCKMDLEELNKLTGGNCTAKNRFGYDTGAPCVLFTLEKVLHTDATWKPEIVRKINEKGAKLRSLTEAEKADYPNYIPFHCDVGPSAAGGTKKMLMTNYTLSEPGFDLRYVPTDLPTFHSGKIRETELDIKNGPMIWLQLHDVLRLNTEVIITCKILDSKTVQFPKKRHANETISIQYTVTNLNQLRGMRTISFSVDVPGAGSDDS